MDSVSIVAGFVRVYDSVSTLGERDALGGGAFAVEAGLDRAVVVAAIARSSISVVAQLGVFNQAVAAHG
ncbi:MAG: hypothetical protein ACJA00_002982 [Myxococcota bacterium]